MSSSRVLDFFVLEATDYVDRLDALLSQADGSPPDVEGFTAQARLLRGSATMARQLPVADLSSALERIGRAVRDDIVEWNAELHGALVAAVDDLRILIRAVRSWGAGDDRRTESRISELVSLYPQATKTRPTPPVNPRNSSFIASESAQLASALDVLVAHPSATDTLAVAAHRLSSLRGVAAINDTPPLAQVLAALDDVLRPLHARGAVLETPHLGLLNSGVQLLRRFSQEIAIGGTLDPNAAVVHDFNAALSGLVRQDAAKPAVVPISHLNFEDGLPQLISASAQPPSTPRQRFRLEAAGPCEHLRHQVSLARAGTDDAVRRRAADEMRSSLLVLRSIAEGFEDAGVVSLIDAVAPELARLNTQSLALLDELARALMDEHSDRRVSHGRLQEMLGERDAVAPRGRTPQESHVPPRWPTPAATVPTSVQPVAPPAAAAAAAAAAGVAASAPVSPPGAPPRAHAPMAGSGLSSALAAGIAGLAQLEEHPLSEPTHLQEDDVVPIADLLYRGREAITRAQEIRDVIRARAGTPQTEELDELFELLDLAATE